MEFKFRAINEQAPTHHPPSSSFNYFTEQAPQAGYSNADNGSAHEFLGNPINVREAILRVLEKERIREEITVAEIARRRLLEAEVRREMLMEREIALRRGDGFSFPWTSLFELRPSILHLSEGISLEERITLSLEARLGHSERREIGVGVQTLPFQRNVEEHMHKISEVKPLWEVRKDKVILQAKPDVNLSGAKRKAVTPPAVGAGGISVTGSKKKPKEEWSCAICQVSATNERVLNEHLQGKKHKAKEAGLRAERTAKNFSLGLFPKKTAKTAKFVETTDNPSSDQKISDYGSSKKSEDDSNKNEVECKKNKCKFWCELCQKGAHSEKVMKDHEKGKKHVSRVQELDWNGEMVEATRKAKDGEEVAGDGKC